MRFERLQRGEIPGRAVADLDHHERIAAGKEPRRTGDRLHLGALDVDLDEIDRRHVRGRQQVVEALDLHAQAAAGTDARAFVEMMAAELDLAGGGTQRHLEHGELHARHRLCRTAQLVGQSRVRLEGEGGHARGRQRGRVETEIGADVERHAHMRGECPHEGRFVLEPVFLFEEDEARDPGDVGGHHEAHVAGQRQQPFVGAKLGHGRFVSSSAGTSP